MIDFINYFPYGYKPNEQQTYILNEISKARDNGYRYVILNAMTGVGKSHIAKALANSVPEPSQIFKDMVYSQAIYEIDPEDEDDEAMIPSLKNGTSILTMTRALQNQYNELFPDGNTLKGKRNYECMANVELPCDLGPCNFDYSFKKCEDCPYFNARDEAVASSCSFYSYSMFLSLPVACRAKKILVCDEAAELEDILVKAYSLTLNFKFLKILKIYIPPTPIKGSPYEEYLSWLRTLKSEVSSVFNEYCKKYNTKTKKKKLKKEEKLRFQAISLLNEQINKLTDAMGKNEFIIEHTSESFVFKPYKVDNLAQDMFKYCDFIVLMSATIIDHNNFAKQLGIKKDEYYYIESPSAFDPKKAPIRASDSICVTYKNKNVTIPKLAKVVKEICKLHKGQKGIIHTHTMDITKTLKNILESNPRFLFRDIGTTNEEILERHIESPEDTILVSPSMTHGIDLKGKLGEFAIIVKAPFMPLTDLRVKRLCNEDNDWYINKMISQFVQTLGRTVRNANDMSITYILDGTLVNYIVKYKERLPKYIIDRFI